MHQHNDLRHQDLKKKMMHSAPYFKKAFLHLVYMYVNVEKGLKVYTPNCLVVNPRKSLIEEMANKRGNSTFLANIYTHTHISVLEF